MWMFGQGPGREQEVPASGAVEEFHEGAACRGLWKEGGAPRNSPHHLGRRGQEEEAGLPGPGGRGHPLARPWGKRSAQMSRLGPGERWGSACSEAGVGMAEGQQPTLCVPSPPWDARVQTVVCSLTNTPSPRPLVSREPCSDREVCSCARQRPSIPNYGNVLLGAIRAPVSLPPWILNLLPPAPGPSLLPRRT